MAKELMESKLQKKKPQIVSADLLNSQGHVMKAI